MQAQDDRARELERLYESRRGRNPSNSAASAAPEPPEHHQLLRSSTSPPSLMYPQYRDDGSATLASPPSTSASASRPLSFLPSPRGEVIDTSPLAPRQLAPAKNAGPRFHNPFAEDRRHPLSASERSMTAPAMAGSGHDKDPRNARGNNADPSLNHLMSMQQGHHDSELDSPFDLGEIDLDTSPDAVAREFSNLQAIRRMSMDVNNQDPDLPAFGVPAMAPSHNDDEDDPSRMYWVPARLHPELAPKEFKTFIQERVRTLKRSSLSDEPLAPGASSGSLRRRKSMLSRQIDNGHGYEDGATRLERKKSQSGQAQPDVNLHELEQMMSDPSSIVRRMSVDQASLDSRAEGPAQQDMPMLPLKPLGSTLKRSTRTQYRKGSLKHKPLLRRQTLREDEDRSNSPSPSPDVPRLPDVPSLPDFSEFTNAAFGLTRVQTEPTPPSTSKPVDNFSRPGRGRAHTPPLQSNRSYDEAPAVQNPEQSQQRPSQDEINTPQSPTGYANGRPAASKPAPLPIPEIVEPQPEPQSEPPQRSPPPEIRHMTPPVMPNRTSSIEQASAPPSGPLPGRPITQRQKLQRPQSLPQRPAQPPNQRPSNVTLDDIAASSLHGNGSGTESQSLTAIPMFDDGKRGEKKKSKDDGSKKWGWFSSGDKEDKSQKNKTKLHKSGEKTHDNARLDLIPTSISGNQPKVRESTVFDRESIHIDDEGKKKKGTGEEKVGIFSSFFGSSKGKKGDKDSHATKSKHSAASLRGLSPDPPPRIMKPDIDFPWTRFSIMEERAIYRMAHIKLANPRRELYSQVLLSNFMYSYLAKVQQMHPHVQIPQSAAQKQAQRQERHQQQKQAEQERKQERQERMEQRDRQAREGQQPQREPGLEEFAQYQRYQEEQARIEQQGPGPNSYQPDMTEEQGRTNPYLDSQMNQSRTQYGQQGQGYGNGQQQYQVNGSMYSNHASEEDWQQQQQQQHHQQEQQWYPVAEHTSGEGRERGYW